MADQARVRRVAERIQVTVASMVEGRIRDPRLGFVTITDVRVSGDLQHATIFYTVLGSDQERQDSAAALNSAKGLIRGEVGKALGIRLTPAIEFTHDALPDTAASMEAALERARMHDAQVATMAASSTYAGGSDPYRKDREVDEDSDQG